MTSLPGIIVFAVAVVCVILSVCAHVRWRNGLDRYLGEWFYDGELDMTFWRYFDGIPEILAELDKEFPGIRAEPRDQTGEEE